MRYRDVLSTVYQKLLILKISAEFHTAYFTSKFEKNPCMFPVLALMVVERVFLLLNLEGRDTIIRFFESLWRMKLPFSQTSEIMYKNKRNEKC